MTAYKKQIGGSHYKDMIMQPSEFINKNRLPFAEGSAIKYICRHAAKGKEQDIDKAIHYLEMIKERDYKRYLKHKQNGLSLQNFQTYATLMKLQLT